jgi:8-oxo-dGTP pyrophosphatase MutT (NUDIX family)
MFNYCPSCGSKNIKFEEERVLRCSDCSLTYYHNIAAATGCIISIPPDNMSGEERLVFLIRGKEPGLGKLDLPGGFVDPGEGVFEGLCRELHEEIGWTPPVSDDANLAKIFTLFASFPNVYPYKGINYNTCDMYFLLSAPGLQIEDLHPEKAEVAGIRFLRKSDINLDDFAFISTRRAVIQYLNNVWVD